jgi:hypothetical protein
MPPVAGQLLGICTEAGDVTMHDMAAKLPIGPWQLVSTACTSIVGPPAHVKELVQHVMVGPLQAPPLSAPHSQLAHIGDAGPS